MRNAVADSQSAAAWQMEYREIDALFKQLDTNGQGSIEGGEFKKAIISIQKAAEDARTHLKSQEVVAEQLRKASVASQVALSEMYAAEKEAMAEEQKLLELRSKMPLAAKLGEILAEKAGSRPVEAMRKWGLTGNKVEFRASVRGLGVEGSDWEIDRLFDQLDDDGSGSLEMSELRAALPRLRGAAKDAAEEALEISKTAAKARRKSYKAVEDVAAQLRDAAASQIADETLSFSKPPKPTRKSSEGASPTGVLEAAVADSAKTAATQVATQGEGGEGGEKQTGVTEFKVVTAKPTIVRQGSNLSSMRLGDLAPGSVVKVHEFVDMPDGARRARTDAGWVTAAKDGHDNLVAVTSETAAGSEAPASTPAEEPTTPVSPPPASEAKAGAKPSGNLSKSKGAKAAAKPKKAQGTVALPAGSRPSSGRPSDGAKKPTTAAVKAKRTATSPTKS